MIDFFFFVDCSLESMSRLTLPKMKRAIHGGIVTSIIIFGLLLIIASVSIAVAFVYFQRKRQRRRQFTYSLESTSDDWEPTGMGYHLFDNSINNRRNPTNSMDYPIIDSNEHVPITNRWFDHIDRRKFSFLLLILLRCCS